MKRNRYAHTEKNTCRDSSFICRGLMEPIGLWVREGGDTAVLHRCRKCGALRSNRLAGDDDERALPCLAEKAVQAVGAARE